MYCLLDGWKPGMVLTQGWCVYMVLRDLWCVLFSGDADADLFM